MKKDIIINFIFNLINMQNITKEILFLKVKFKSNLFSNTNYSQIIYQIIKLLKQIIINNVKK